MYNGTPLLISVFIMWGLIIAGILYRRAKDARREK